MLIVMTIARRPDNVPKPRPSMADRIELRRTRDFGAIINVIFEFLRLNWKPLGRSLLFIMTPVLLVAIIAASVYVRAMIGSVEALDQLETDPLSMYAGIWPWIALSGLSFLVSLIALFSLVGGYVRLYIDRAPEPITVDDVWLEVRSNFWRVAVTTFLSLIIVVIPIMLLVIPGAVMDSIPLLVLSFLLVIPVTVYLYTVLSIIIPLRLEEEIGFVAAVRRCMMLVQGRWWFTFGIFFVIQIILFFASAISGLPLQAAMMSSMLVGESASLVIIVVGAALSTIGSFLLYAVLVLTASVVYYNLVEEKEGVGMADRIGEIGSELDGARVGG